MHLATVQNALSHLATSPHETLIVNDVLFMSVGMFSFMCVLSYLAIAQ